MNRILSLIYGRLLDKQLDFHVRVFNVLAVAGIFVSLLSTIVSVIINDPPAMAVLYMAFCLLSVGLLYFSIKTGKYQLCYTFAIVMIFMIGFPMFFWYGGGNYGAMPYFFIFAIVFTIFMLEGNAALFISLLELALYTGVSLCSHYFYQPQPRYLESESMMLETIFGFLVVSSALSVTMYIQIRLYNEQQRTLAEQNKELDNMNRNKTEFLGNVSHELKTPLTVISGYAQESGRRLADMPEMADIERNMKLIASEAERMALMVSQILDVTRIDEDRMVFNISPAPLSQILQNTLQTYYPVFRKNNNTILLERGGDSPVVLCDSQKIEQVLVNLISNAARHTHDGRITIGVKEADGCVTVTVKDTGEGIPLERQGDLFQRYKSSAGNPDSGSGRETGTGLGLFICKYIVEGHGGEISIESGDHIGTTVRFTLPAHN